MTKNYSHKAVVLLLSFIIPFIASAYDCYVDGIYYNLDKSTQTASVKYKSIMHDFNSTDYSGIVHIPEKINCEGTTYRVTEIGERAFYNCWDLTSITILNSVTDIGGHAFEYCRGLTSITIPNSVTNIGDYAFSYCYGLTSIDVDSDNSNYASYNGVLFSKDMTRLIQCPGRFSGSFVVPTSVKEIGEGAFAGCRLTSITISNSVTNIGFWAFGGCPNLTNIDVDSDNPNYASYNGVLFSKDMTRLIQCPQGFSGSFVIPNSVTNIGDYAFIYCDRLTSINIPTSVTNIGDYAFTYCSSLTSINIPNSVTNIGDYAFRYCRSLTELIIGNSVTSIGDYAFSGCYNLKELIIGNSVTMIGGHAFSGCSGLTSITIPNSVTNIGSSAFFDCSGLTSIDVDSNNPNYASYNGVLFSKDMTLLIQCPMKFSGSFVVPNSVTNIGDYAFYDCSGIAKLTIGNSVTDIGNSAFSGCSSLTGALTIPNSVTSIGNYAFYNCYDLEKLIIGNGITEIGNGAFYGCYNLTSVYYNTQNPIASDEYLFHHYSATLYVPKGAVDTFKATTPWNKFNKIEEYDFGGVTDAIADKCGEIDYTHPYEIYNFNGTKVGDNKDTLAPGLYIIRQGTITKKISVQ